MIRSTRRGALAALAAVALTATTAAAAAAPSFQDFKASTFQDTDGTFIVNGDEPVDSGGELRQFYDRLVAEPETATEGLIVNTVNGRDDKWSASSAQNLTYCVSSKFGTKHASMVNYMTAGAGQWEAATGGVNFVHDSSQDSKCTTRNNSVVFSVEPTNTTQYIARAFFPSSTKRTRNVLVNYNALVTAGSWTPSNIVAHELGHTLGLRHEHTRPEAGTCFEDNNWRPLTAYDSSSIMHYPQCNGTSTNLSMTDMDRAGIRALYGN